jgi:hypothetical protein
VTACRRLAARRDAIAPDAVAVLNLYLTVRVRRRARASKARA